jgi:hypothetical protein
MNLKSIAVQLAIVAGGVAVYFLAIKPLVDKASAK